MSQVPFAFQADVIGGSSLLHAAAGRLLKSLSDGGIDFYAVAAAVELGKTMPIQSAHESSVSILLQQRGGRSGFLAKTLSIGWGHSDVPIEMARTRAGTSALVTINALATGTTAYCAAEAFAALLTMSGCEADMLPNIDVLKKMIAYLSPFLAEGGFRKMLEHITSHVRRALLPSHNVPGNASFETNLTATGEPGAWAKAVRQLILTAERNEMIYLLANQRGAWLAAYGNHILGMHVKIVLRGEVLWEGAGTKGRLTIELDQAPVSQITKSNSFFILEKPATPAGSEAVAIDYQLGEALTIELGLLPDLTLGASHAIQTAIVRFAGKLEMWVTIEPPPRLGSDYLQDFSAKLSYDAQHGHPINGGFRNHSRLISVCTDLGVSKSSIEEGLSWLQSTARRWGTLTPRVHGFDFSNFLTAQDLAELKRWTGSTSLFDRAKNLVHGFGITIFALLSCVYDPLVLRIRSDAISNAQGSLAHGVATSIKREKIIELLSRLVHGHETAMIVHPSCLAISISDTTIYTKALFDEEAFDSEGRTIAICSGRITYSGAQRNQVIESLVHSGGTLSLGNFTNRLISPEASVSRIVRDFPVTPHYIESSDNITIQAKLEENVISISTGVNTTLHGQARVIPVSLHTAIYSLLRSEVGEACKHPRETPLVATETTRLEVASFLSHAFDNNSDDVFAQAIERPVRLFALKGIRSKQLVQLAFLYTDFHGALTEHVILQERSCLSCAVKHMRKAAVERAATSPKGHDDIRDWGAAKPRKVSLEERETEQSIVVVMT